MNDVKPDLVQSDPESRVPPAQYSAFLVACGAFGRAGPDQGGRPGAHRLPGAGGTLGHRKRL